MTALPIPSWHRRPIAGDYKLGPVQDCGFTATITREGAEWRVVIETYDRLLESFTRPTLREAKSRAESAYYTVAGL